MNNSKLQQVFSHIILNSLPDNKEGLYKEANFFRSLWDLGRALFRGSSRFRQELTGLQSTLKSNPQGPLDAQTIQRISEYAEPLKKLHPNVQELETFLQNLKSNTPDLSKIQTQIPGLIESTSRWQLMRANPFKTITLGLTTVPAAGALATGGYYGTRGLVRNLLGTDPTTVRETIQQGISEGLRTGLQNVGLADEQGKISFTNLTNNLRTDLGNLIGGLKTDLGGLMGILGADLKGLTGTLGTDLKGLTGDLRKDLKGLMDAAGQDFKQSLVPQVIRQAGTSLGQGVIGSITDPMFQAVGIDPNSISPPLKLLILLGLAGGTFGLASRLAQAF